MQIEYITTILSSLKVAERRIEKYGLEFNFGGKNCREKFPFIVSKLLNLNFTVAEYIRTVKESRIDSNDLDKRLSIIETAIEICIQQESAD